jgi:hypothetical protein
MTIRKAVERLVWRFSNGWNVNQLDADALNMIQKFVEDKHKKQIQDYHLFAKLYIMVYAQYLERYKTTIFDDIPRKELHKLLDLPVDNFIQRLTQRLNESELYSLFNDLDIELTHPATKSIQCKAKELNALTTALNDSNNKEKFCGEIWDYETVKENIELQINNVINKFK